MQQPVLILFFVLISVGLFAQTQADSLAVDSLSTKEELSRADDPAQFITRVEIFNELQYYDQQDVYLNQSIFRSVVKIGKKFSTRLDIPYVSNTTVTSANYQKMGIGDISFRLLGFKFRETKKSAFTISMEVSMNTAQSPMLGSGKNVLLPMISLSSAIPKNKMLYSVIFQHANSVSGDENRNDISFSKLQVVLLKAWSRKFWTVLAPEWYYDYVNNGFSMNLRSRMTYAPKPRVNLWVTPSAGIFGDFAGRYTWSIDVGFRYFLFRENRK